MNPEQQAIDVWFDSEEGKSCSNAETLKLEKKQEQYLRNRLWKAFIAGMKAGEEITKGKMIGKFTNLINSL